MYILYFTSYSNIVCISPFEWCGFNSFQLFYPELEVIKAEFFRHITDAKCLQQWGVNAYLDLSTAIYIKNFFHSIQRMPFIPTLKHRSLSNKKQSNCHPNYNRSWVFAWWEWGANFVWEFCKLPWERTLWK